MMNPPLFILAFADPAGWCPDSWHGEINTVPVLLCEKHSTAFRDEVSGKVLTWHSINSKCGMLGGAKEGAEKP